MVLEINRDIEELNLLWKPIRPYLTTLVEELYGRQDGHVVEIGPFSGLLFDLVRKKIGHRFLIAAFPSEVIPAFQSEAREEGMEGRVRIIESDPSLIGVADESVDLAIFRGALFFPALFQVDLKAIYRTLKTGGVALVGGGYGKHTPPEVIAPIGKRSEQLNAAVGRVRITVESVRDELRSSNLEGSCRIVTEGGLWVVMRK
jgi:hypothetical protein